MTTVTHILPDKLDDVWAQVSTLIDSAQAHAPAQADYRAILSSGEMGLYVVSRNPSTIDGVMVCQFVDVPGERVLRIVIMAGMTRDETIAIMKPLGVVAKTYGASAIEAFGRKGFEKWCTGTGFKPIHTVYRCEVE